MCNLRGCCNKRKIFSPMPSLKEIESSTFSLKIKYGILIVKTRMKEMCSLGRFCNERKIVSPMSYHWP